MKVEQYSWGFLETHTFLFEDNNHVLAIDPTDQEELLTKCCGAASVTVLLTHEHFDHISGLNKLRDSCKSLRRVIAGEICSERIQDAKSNMSVYADVLAEVAEKPLLESISPFTCRAADITFKDYYAFCWTGHTVEIFSTPGHSAGSCCILVDDMLFVGDTVLENNLMAQFPGSSKKLYRNITVPLLEKLLLGKMPEQLPQKQLQSKALLQGECLQGTFSSENRITRVYPGHGDVMTPEVALALARNV